MNNDLVAINNAVARLDETINGYEQDAVTAKNAIQSLQDELAKTKSDALVPKSTGLARVIPNLNRAVWTQPSNAGDTGGSDPTKPSGTFLMTPGDIAEFSAKGGYPYNNGYWYIKYQGFSGKRFVQTLDVMYPTSADIAASQAIEFELQMSLDGFVYNMAWQSPVRTHAFWRTFDYTNRKWVATGLPSHVFVPGVWYSFAAEYLADTDVHTITHVSLSVDGNVLPVNVTRPATAVSQSKYLSTGFQLDSDSKNPPTPYRVYARNMHIIY
jgi:hypothetical protein